jgi:hypothetical protein
MVTFLKGLQKKLLKEGGVPLNAAKATLDDVKNEVQWGGGIVKTGDNAIYNKIAAAMHEDVDAGLIKVRPDLKEALTTANKFYKDNIDLLNSKWGKAIYANKGKPDLIVKSILTKDMSSVDVPKFMKEIGTDAADSIRVATLKDIFEGSTSKATGNFTGTGIAEKLSKNTDKLKAILTPEQYKVVSDISKLSRAAAKGDKIAQGSQTGFIIQKMPELIGAVAGGATSGGAGAAVGIVTAMVGQAMWNKFISSPIGRKWMTTGIPLNTAKVVNPVSKAVRLAQPVVKQKQGAENIISRAMSNTMGNDNEK